MNANNAFPLWALLGILVTCGIVVGVLVPTDKQILHRLIKDGKAQRALEMLRSIPEQQKAKDPATYELMRLRLERQLLDPRAKATVAGQLERTLRAFQRYAFADEFLTEVLALASMLDDADGAFDRILPFFDKFPAGAREVIMGKLVKDALASNKPGSAARIYEACLRAMPANPTTIMEVARLWRSAGQPAKALKVLEDFEAKAGRNLFTVSRPLGELRVDLLPEVGRSSEAFDLIYQFLDSETNHAALNQWLPTLESTASNMQQRRRLLQEYSRLLERAPDNEESWRSVAELAMKLDDLAYATEAYKRLVNLSPGNRAYFRKLAELYEWTGKPSDAFNLYLRLAKDNDVAALDRLIALNPGLYRDEEILETLRALSPQLQDRYALILARLLTKQGEYDDANLFFEKYLEKRSEDIRVLEQYAHILMYQYKYARALEVLKKLANIKPNDLLIAKNIGEARYLLGDFEASFTVYQELARRSNDPDVLQKYGTLAQCLGKYRDVSEALARQLENMKEPSPEDFVRLAYAYEIGGAKEKRRETLEKGLHQFPDDDGLRLQLAVLFAEKKEYQHAIDVLRQHRHLKTDLTAMHLYLNLLSETHDTAAAEKFLKSGVDEKKLQAASIRRLLATIYEGNRNYPAAARIYQSLYDQDPSNAAYALGYARLLNKVGKNNKAQSILKPLLQSPSPDVLKEAAQLYAEMGRYAEAEMLQKRFLEVAQNVAFQDWSYLGDIRSSAGNRSGAYRAYQQALQLFDKRLQARKRSSGL